MAARGGQRQQRRPDFGHAATRPPAMKRGHREGQRTTGRSMAEREMDKDA